MPPHAESRCAQKQVVIFASPADEAGVQPADADEFRAFEEIDRPGVLAYSRLISSGKSLSKNGANSAKSPDSMNDWRRLPETFNTRVKGQSASLLLQSISASSAAFMKDGFAIISASCRQIIGLLAMRAPRLTSRAFGKGPVSCTNKCLIPSPLGPYLLGLSDLVDRGRCHA
jgi:hypothetical protein